jgi:dihydroflavonol-4-reductase
MEGDAWALVTGASGFVGSRLVRHLVERGERVKAFVRAGANLKPIADLPMDRVQVVFGDVMVMHTVYRALAGCDRMYHVAAAYKLWDKHPQRIIDIAVKGTEAVLDAARRRGLRKIVVTSSLGAVGVTERPEPMTEDTEFTLKNPEPYVRAKRREEDIALECAANGQPIVVVCPGSIFGPGDWKPTPTGKLVLQALAMPIVVAGESGGVSVADVDDVAQGHRLAMEHGRVGERYILGGDNLRYGEVLELLFDIAGVEKRIVHPGRGPMLLAASLMELWARLRGGEPLITAGYVRDYVYNYLWASSEKAEHELGYTHRPARQALSRSVRWYLEHKYFPEKVARELQIAAA